MQFNYRLFSLKIIDKRRSLNLTQRDTARSIGIHVSTFARFEHEGYRGSDGEQLLPNIERYYKVCRWLQMPMESFFTSK